MSINMLVYMMALIVIILGICFVISNYFNIKRPKTHAKEEEDHMYALSKSIREGAKVFMRTEYGTIIPVVIVIALLFSLFIEKTSGLTFALGACMSSAAVFIGMYGATYANYRVTRRAFKSKSVGRTVWTALKGGSISGLSVQSFGMLGITAVYVLQYLVFKDNSLSTGLIANLPCDTNIMRCTTYSLGCSTVAIFNRVAGGNFTKSADISADILNKLRHDLPEDDPRIPNVLADFIGDMVNDVAGNCSDLLESFVATLVAANLLSRVVYSQYDSSYEALYNLTCLYPVAIATIGLLGCIIGIGLAMLRKESMGENPAGELNLVSYVAAGVTIIGSLIVSYLMFGRINLYPEFKLGWKSPWIAALFGIISGVIIGKITEIYTSTDHGFVKSLAKVSPEGVAFLITLGDALGFRSCLLPGITIAVSIIASYQVCGLYGIAIASLGMLSFVGATVSIDAFGPISDNAGGIAEGCHLDPEVRAITDRLDATGNTTAAIGKGFAIGSAAYATVSLIFAYIGNYSTDSEIVLNMASPITIAGGLVGVVLVAYFIALLLVNTINSSVELAKAGDQQLTNHPGILTGEELPDYNSIIRAGTESSLKKMILPSMLAIVVPIPCLMLGYQFMGGVLIGATLFAIPMAIFMGNSGGAFDNTKKYLEEGLLPGYEKGSEAHKNTVVIDTVGDPRKDVAGVNLDIFIKIMSTVANTLAPVFSNLRLLYLF